MKTSAVLILVLSVVFWWGCNETSDQNDAAVQVSAEAALADAEALDLLKINCYACHNPMASSHDVILAPPLAAVKWRYLRSYPEREEFIAQMTAFVNNPTQDKALMRGAVQRFQVMPQSPTDSLTVQKIVTYLYDHKPEEPSWFAEHFEEEHGRKWGPQ
jgi:hypothetical protein